MAPEPACLFRLNGFLGNCFNLHLFTPSGEFSLDELGIFHRRGLLRIHAEGSDGDLARRPSFLHDFFDRLADELVGRLVGVLRVQYQRGPVLLQRGRILLLAGIRARQQEMGFRNVRGLNRILFSVS